MKSLARISVIAALTLFIFSAANASGFEIAGTYGVCDDDPSAIELTLNEDHTFTYQDFSNPAKKTDIQGHWELKNNRIVLNAGNATFSFHDKWKIVKNGMVAKSRRGMTFYSLRRK